MYRLASGGVIRELDGAFVPGDAGNRDWLGYLAWINAGGVPDTRPMPDVVDEPPALNESQVNRIIEFLKDNPDIVSSAKL